MRYSFLRVRHKTATAVVSLSGRLQRCSSSEQDEASTVDAAIILTTKFRLPLWLRRRSVTATAREYGARGAIGAEIVDAVDGEQIGKPGARAIDAALDGSDRAAANCRSVVI